MIAPVNESDRPFLVARLRTNPGLSSMIEPGTEADTHGPLDHDRLHGKSYSALGLWVSRIPPPGGS